jgi:hypothetical protein
MDMWRAPRGTLDVQVIYIYLSMYGCIHTYIYIHMNIRLPGGVKIMDMCRAPRGTLDVQVDMNICV